MAIALGVAQHGPQPGPTPAARSARRTSALQTTGWEAGGASEGAGRDPRARSSNSCGGRQMARPRRS
eukprot:11239349-Alexandrium_andersonii.AAC.1